ncbi:hypothetical protein [Mariprofundus erugo]|uniref:hypothetical protein n=1 Tax=Mariprofundus erugo TaxID=2528639 RepID=UPI00137564F5|nr:hypothetical protein [Mariprofundus erugo]
MLERSATHPDPTTLVQASRANLAVKKRVAQSNNALRHCRSRTGAPAIIQID